MSAYWPVKEGTSTAPSTYVWSVRTVSPKSTPRLRGMRLAGHYRGRPEQAR